MFRFSREQSVVNIGGVKIGGQPGELPTALCGTIFYQGQRILQDDEKGLFDHARAERLIARQAELAEETGCPAVLHIYARSIQAVERYLDFSDGVWSGPLIIDSADSATRAGAAQMATELGYADRTVYNSLSLATEEEEAEAIRESDIDSAIILAYNPADPGVDGSLAVLETGGRVMEEGLLPKAAELGLANLLIDPGPCRLAAEQEQLCASLLWPKAASAFQWALEFTMRFRPGNGCLQRTGRQRGAAMRQRQPCSFSRQPTSFYTGPLRAPSSYFPQLPWQTYS